MYGTGTRYSGCVFVAASKKVLVGNSHSIYYISLFLFLIFCSQILTNIKTNTKIENIVIKSTRRTKRKTEKSPSTVTGETNGSCSQIAIWACSKPMEVFIGLAKIISR